MEMKTTVVCAVLCDDDYDSRLHLPLMEKRRKPSGKNAINKASEALINDRKQTKKKIQSRISGKCVCMCVMFAGGIPEKCAICGNIRCRQYLSQPAVFQNNLVAKSKSVLLSPTYCANVSHKILTIYSLFVIQ